MGSSESTPVVEVPGDSKIIERRNRNIKRMDQAVRKKLRGGVQFNMKVVIRGCKGTGKTSLWKRLQGLPLASEYKGTDEIQTTNINWSFRNVEEVVKVEVWDVVDETKLGRKEGLGGDGLGLDASVVNVYQNAQAAIFMVDRNRPETFDYVARRLEGDQITPATSVLVLINFKDVPVVKPSAPGVPREGVSPPISGDSPAPTAVSTAAATATNSDAAPAPSPVSSDEATASSASIAADDMVSATVPPWGRMGAKEVAVELSKVRAGIKVHCFECSMANCFGLKLLYTYLNVPFLNLKRYNLEQALSVLETDSQQAEKALCSLVDASPYEAYLDHIASRPSHPASRPKAKHPSRASSERPSPGGHAGGHAPEADPAAEGAEEIKASPIKPGAPVAAEALTSATPEAAGAEKAEAAAPVAPVAKSKADIVDDEMKVLNARALKSGGFEDFFSDEEEEDEGAADVKEISSTQGAAETDDDDDWPPPAMATEAVVADTESDDEYYAAPKFGISSSVVPARVPAQSPATSDEGIRRAAVEDTGVTPAEAAPLAEAPAGAGDDGSSEKAVDTAEHADSHAVNIGAFEAPAEVGGEPAPKAVDYSDMSLQDRDDVQREVSHSPEPGAHGDQHDSVDQDRDMTEIDAAAEKLRDDGGDVDDEAAWATAAPAASASWLDDDDDGGGGRGGDGAQVGAGISDDDDGGMSDKKQGSVPVYRGGSVAETSAGAEVDAAESEFTPPESGSSAWLDKDDDDDQGEDGPRQVSDAAEEVLSAAGSHASSPTEAAPGTPPSQPSSPPSPPLATPPPTSDGDEGFQSIAAPVGDPEYNQPEIGESVWRRLPVAEETEAPKAGETAVSLAAKAAIMAAMAAAEMDESSPADGKDKKKKSKKSEKEDKKKKSKSKKKKDKTKDDGGSAQDSGFYSDSD